MKIFVKRILIFTLFLVSAAGFYMHYNYHPFAKHVYGYVPFFAGLLSVFLIPILFNFRKTLHLAYLLNGFTAIIGFITMTHFSIAKAPLYPHLMFVTAKFFLGWLIFTISLFNLEGEARHTGWRTIRYPNLGFWFVHLCTLSLVYWLGNILWR